MNENRKRVEENTKSRCRWQYQQVGAGEGIGKAAREYQRNGTRQSKNIRRSS